MKHILLQVIFILSINLTHAQNNTWLNPQPQGNNLNDVFFINETTGWAVGNAGVILKTTNGGQNWIVSNTTSCFKLNKVFFLNNDKGWIVGNSGLILKTNNGGESWEVKSSGLQPTVTNLFNLTSIQFSNDLVGYATSEIYGHVLKSIDGGESWSIQYSYLSAYTNKILVIDSDTVWLISQGRISKTVDGGESWQTKYSNYSYNFSSIQFITPNVGWAMGNYGAMLKTVDGGENWTLISNLSTRNVYNDFAFIDENIGFALEQNAKLYKTTDGGVTWSFTQIEAAGAISNGNLNSIFIVGNKGLIYKSVNLGDTWVKISTDSNFKISNMYFHDRNIGWAINNYQNIIKTVDGGLTWQNIFSPPNLQFGSVFFINSNTGWAIGNLGIFSANPKMYKTVDGGLNWTELNLNGFSNYLHSIYFATELNGIAVGNLGKILYTTDGGINWNNGISGLGTGNSSQLSGVFMTDAVNGWCIGGGSHILKTIDGGLNWSIFSTDNPAGVGSLYFINTSIGYAVGQNGVILFTSNGGKNWLTINDGGGSLVFNYVKFFDVDTGFAIGSDSNSMKVYQTIDSGKNWIKIPLPFSNSGNLLFDSTEGIGFNPNGSLFKFKLVFETLNSGNWNETSTWTCNCLPDGSLPVKINENHNLVIPNGVLGQTKGINNLGAGTLTIQADGGLVINK